MSAYEVEKSMRGVQFLMLAEDWWWMVGEHHKVESGDRKTWKCRLLEQDSKEV